MTSTIRTTLSAATYIGLVPFLLSSAILAGPFAGPTVIGFSLLVAYGVLGITALSYSGPNYIRLRAELGKTAV